MRGSIQELCLRQHFHHWSGLAQHHTGGSHKLFCFAHNVRQLSPGGQKASGVWVSHGRWRESDNKSMFRTIWRCAKMSVLTCRVASPSSLLRIAFPY